MGLSHLDESGAARMVSISDKPETHRTATAQARVQMMGATLALIRASAAQKGDVLATARLAGISAAKATSTLIPLCHPIRITGLDVALHLDEELPGVIIEVSVAAMDRTGPEMEALTAAAVAALTVIDMCKGSDRTLVIRDVVLLGKSGGRSGGPPPTPQ